ncbi:hypothetical protein TSOC_011551 [Tetrabaena socialis]|uniref:phytol kinase n=1 Tax=Tetrabaena socialis TaxID=47790 RepID=A0A2J7ZQB8_9CHLO|nr:hypothetical protein TSOC_011551 [Tetrabaena socialis]|eukprot:PNH02468.1 hypothetical protein TSOC_011551 [Tetrabaena socialis]
MAPEALDRRVRSALRRLPALVDRLLADDAKEDDAEEMFELLVRLKVYLDRLAAGSAEKAAAAASILEVAAVHSALLRLVAAVVRWPLLAPSSNLASSSGSGSSGGGSTSGSGNGGSGSGGSGTGSSGTGGSSSGSTSEPSAGASIQAYASVAWETGCLVDALLELLFAQPHIPPAALDFIEKLRRMDTLQCLARQFATAADSVGALTAQQAGFAGSLFHLLGSLLVTLQMDPKEEEEALHASRCRELATVLCDSHVMEHAARLLLRLMLQGAPTDAALSVANPTANMSHMFLTAYQNITVQSKIKREEGQDAAATVLREVVSGRCVRHVVLIHGVAALCMADGGPAYGLPTDVQQAVSARLAEAFPPGPTEVDLLAESISLSLRAALAYVEPSPPVGARAAVMLLLRLARLAVTSGDVWAAHVQQQRAGLPAHAGGARSVVPRHRVVTVAKGSLEAAWCLLRERLAAHPPAWAEEAGVECWRLVAASFSRNMLRWADDHDQLHRTGLLLLYRWVPLPPAGEPLPPAPPPGLAAVLAGGLLPCLERLLRRAGEEPDGPESAVVEALLRREHTWELWAHLLEYGEPRQAAALVATLGKLLRRASPTLLGLQARARPGSCVPAISIACANVLTGSIPFALTLAEGRQLAHLLAYAACAWLSALSGCALQVMADQPAPDSNGLWCLLRPLLCWLPLLVWRCTSAGGVEAATSSSSAAAAAAGDPSAADDICGWRRLLLEEMRVVPLLGRALRLAQPPPPGFFPLVRAALAQSCCTVAAAFPDEVLRAASSSAWPPERLRALLPELREQGRGALVDGTEELAAMLEKGWAGLRGISGSGSGISGGRIVACESILTAAANLDGASCKLAALLVLPAAACGLLRICSYRGCTSLAGDSEADARMRWCRFCNSSCYCCGECQLSHWREGGHKEACPGGAKVRPG